MTLGADYFDDLYLRRDDPWRLAERWYERRKRALTIASLPRERFARGLELGCSIGTLTAELGSRVDRLLAIDSAARAVELARERVGRVASVEFAVMNVPDEWPAGRFDLVVLSEVAYYFDEATLARVLDRTIESLDPGGVLVTCHWRHPVTDYPLGGDRVQEMIRDRDELSTLSRYVDEDVRLEVFTKGPAVSVATAEGLVDGK